jgi:hypothetical protein
MKVSVRDCGLSKLVAGTLPQFFTLISMFRASLLPSKLWVRRAVSVTMLGTWLHGPASLFKAPKTAGFHFGLPVTQA